MSSQNHQKQENTSSNGNLRVVLLSLAGFLCVGLLLFVTYSVGVDDGMSRGLESGILVSGIAQETASDNYLESGVKEFKIQNKDTFPIGVIKNQYPDDMCRKLKNIADKVSDGMFENSITELAAIINKMSKCVNVYDLAKLKKYRVVCIMNWKCYNGSDREKACKELVNLGTYEGFSNDQKRWIFNQASEGLKILIGNGDTVEKIEPKKEGNSDKGDTSRIYPITRCNISTALAFLVSKGMFDHPLSQLDDLIKQIQSCDNTQVLSKNLKKYREVCLMNWSCHNGTGSLGACEDLIKLASYNGFRDEQKKWIVNKANEGMLKLKM